ncbi:MAG: hypothetical protein CM1200mP18_04660 [Gammaproteobacteria bacterium]|nr:MAG: hypothetical protein CM1200mP18_04660 [Gammaproteobacteria bacterium]
MFDTELTRQRYWLGSTAALMSAIAFSTNVALSRLAYDFGTNLHALNLIRAVVFLAVLIIAVWLSGSRVSIERKELYRCLVLGYCCVPRCICCWHRFFSSPSLWQYSSSIPIR